MENEKGYFLEIIPGKYFSATQFFATVLTINELMGICKNLEDIEVTAVGPDLSWFGVSWALKTIKDLDEKFYFKTNIVEVYRNDLKYEIVKSTPVIYMLDELEKVIKP